MGAYGVKTRNHSNHSKETKMSIRTMYSRHALHAHLGGWQPLTFRQFVAIRASIAFEGSI